MLLKVLQNIQVQQTLILSLVLFIWVVFFKLDISLLEISTTFSIVIALDFFLQNMWRKKWEKWVFPFSWVNAGFGICFFLRSLDIVVYIFAAFIAIFSKHLIQTSKGRHFLNPSNFGVCLTLLLFPQYTWLNALQWGNYAWSLGESYVYMLLFVFALWSYMCLKIYKSFHFGYIYDYILPFLLTHFFLFFIIPYHETWSSFFTFFNISFFIFTFFMMTDPKTVPQQRISRIFYAISLVLSFYIFQFYINEYYALLFSLFYNTLLLPVIWKLEHNYKNIIIFYVILYIVYTCLLTYLILNYGQPDLVFDNVCNQLICK